MKESFFSEINSFKMEMLQPNINVSESIDSSKRLIKQRQDEIIFLRRSWGTKIIQSNMYQIKAQWDCLFKYSYRKSANDIILSTNEKKSQLIRVAKSILTKKVFWTTTSYCTKKVLSLRSQVFDSWNQIQRREE